MARPAIPYGCACGETRARLFSAGYKTLCSACRSTRERERQAALTGKPVGKARKKPPRRRATKVRASWIDIITSTRKT